MMRKRRKLHKWTWCPAVVILVALLVLLVSLVASSETAEESARLGISSARLQHDELASSNTSATSIDEIAGVEDEAPEDNEKTKGLNSTDLEERGGGSRLGVGGIEADVFPWIVIFWINPEEKRLLEKSDGYLTGLGLRIKNHYFICELGTPLRGANKETFYSPHERFRGLIQDFVQYKPTQTIDVSVGRQGPEGKPEKGKGGYTLWHVDTLKPINKLITNLAIYHMTYRNGNGNDPKVLKDAASLTASQLPVLQSDINVKDDCWLYTYASRWDKNQQLDISVNQQTKRSFSRWPVKRVEEDNCQEGMCKFKNDLDRMKENDEKGAICRGWSDVGAPIMCGTNPPKLSYIVLSIYLHDSYNASDKRDCFIQTFNAKRLADHYEILKQPQKLNRGID